jgi:transposase-like protein
MSEGEKVTAMSLPAVIETAVSNEVPEKPVRRRYTLEYKKRILAEYDRLPRGEQGALLRREGLYSSHVDSWRKQRDAGVDQALMPKKRGRKTQPSNPLARENAELRRKLTRTEAALKQARAIIDIQKKLSEELGIPLEPIESDESA